MSVENAEAGLLAGIEHVFQDDCNVDSGGFVDDERGFPGEGFVGGYNLQTEAASGDKGQKDSADDKREGPAGNGVAAGNVFEERKQQDKADDESGEEHERRQQPKGVGS